WLDSAILYIASNQRPKFSAEQVDKLRNYALAGGMIFLQADTSSDAFNQYVSELAAKLFPEYELTDLPPTHELYTISYQLKPPRPRLRGVSNGARLLLVHSPVDVAISWQARQEKARRVAFELGVNLFVYAAGKPDVHNRLAPLVYPQLNRPVTGTLPVAR